MTTLKDLKQIGGQVPTKPIKKEITFTLEGEEYTASIFVKKLGIGEYEALYLVDDKDNRSRTAKTISTAITLGEDGKEAISFQDAYRLQTPLASAMLQAFGEVNGGKKSSPPENDSSANSA